MLSSVISIWLNGLNSRRVAAIYNAGIVKFKREIALFVIRRKLANWQEKLPVYRHEIYIK
jgi:hypothetical protein